jgi:nucleoside-diphosphate-sugar epimerase
LGEAYVQTRPANIGAVKVVITGASGFLGSHLRRRLLKEGAEVHAISRSRRSSESEGIRWWQADMADGESTRRLLHEIKPDLIFHLSGLATASPERELVLPTLYSLLVATVNVLTAAEVDCRRVILAASLTEPQPDQSEITPGSPYAAAKWAIGAYARMFHKLYGAPVVLLRPFMTYGPGQDERKLIPYVILSLLQGHAPKLSSGEQRIDWVYVDDVIDGFIAAASAPEIEGQTIDLGSGVLTSVRTVVDRIKRITGVQVDPLFSALLDRPFQQERMADLVYAKNRLHWTPKTSLEEGLERTVAWYQQRMMNSLGTTDSPPMARFERAPWNRSGPEISARGRK